MMDIKPINLMLLAIFGYVGYQLYMRSKQKTYAEDVAEEPLHYNNLPPVLKQINSPEADQLLYTIHTRNPSMRYPQ